MNVNQNNYCNLDESGHVKSRRTCWRMPEYDEKMDYILFDDYDLTYEDDKWVLIEDIKIFQSIIEDFMRFPVSSEKEIRTNQMSKDVKNFLLRQQRLANYDLLLKKIENAELTQIAECSTSFRKRNVDISDTNCPYWGEWVAGHCSKSCGSGMKLITRNCYQNNTEVDVSLCQREYSDQQIYEKNEHCTDETFCSFEPWGSWNRCDKTCGSGTQRRWRKCPSNSCSGSDNEKRICNTRKCVSQWSSWTSSGQCTKERFSILKL